MLSDGEHLFVSLLAAQVSFWKNVCSGRVLLGLFVLMLLSCKNFYVL